MTCHSVLDMVYRTTNRALERRRARRELLIEAARREFGRDGYHVASVPSIVKAARSSIGAFYLYFNSKEEVFIAVLNAVGRDVSASLNDAQRSGGNDVAKQMRAAIKALVTYLVANPADARVLLLDGPSLPGEIHNAWRLIVQSHTRSVETALNALSSRTNVIDVPTASTCWVGSVSEAVLRWLERPEAERPTAEVLASAIVQFNLNGIGIAVNRD